MRDNPNKVIKVIKKNSDEYVMFITGKMLSFYLLLFNVSTWTKISARTYELHAYGQTKAVRFFCDKDELEKMISPRG